MGLGGFVILLILSVVFKRDFFSLVGAGTPADDPTAAAPAGPVQTTPEEDERAQFVTFVLNDAQDTWTKILADRGKQYEHATLVLFRDATQTACGVGQAGSRPLLLSRRQHGSTSISASTTSSGIASARRGTSPRPT